MIGDIIVSIFLWLCVGAITIQIAETIDQILFWRFLKRNGYTRKTFEKYLNAKNSWGIIWDDIVLWPIALVGYGKQWYNGSTIAITRYE